MAFDVLTFNQGEFVLVIGARTIGLATIKFVRIAGGKVIALDINEKCLQFCDEKLNVTQIVNASAKNG